jgi:hypothetical protein
MAQVRDDNLTLSAHPADAEFTSVIDVLQHPWVRDNVLGSRHDASVPTYPELIITRAALRFGELRAFERKVA